MVKKRVTDFIASTGFGVTTFQIFFFAEITVAPIMPLELESIATCQKVDPNSLYESSPVGVFRL